MRSLRDVYETFKDLGVVETGRDFGILVGRSESYLSSSISRHRRPSTESLLCLIASIADIIKSTNEEAFLCQNPSQRDEYLDGALVLKEIEEETWAEIWGRVAPLP